MSALPVFLGTLPLLAVMVWNLMDVKSLRGERSQLRGEMNQLRAQMNAEFQAIRAELIAIRAEIAGLRELVAILEERDRLTHPVLIR
jgi:hypothetical protein